VCCSVLKYVVLIIWVIVGGCCTHRMRNMQDVRMVAACVAVCVALIVAGWYASSVVAVCCSVLQCVARTECRILTMRAKSRAIQILGHRFRSGSVANIQIH